MPRSFVFATRSIAEEPIGGAAGDDLLGPGDPQVRDTLQLGNLMVVAADNGEVIAFDVSAPTAEAGFRRQARLDNVLRASARTLATDGHGRIFWSGLHGSLWSIKAARVEDIRTADRSCADAPSWAEGVPC